MQSKIEKKFDITEIFKNSPNRNICYIWNDGRLQKVTPQNSSDIKCPVCGSKKGYTCLYDPKKTVTDWVWGCLEQKCLEINTKGAQKLMNKLGQ